MVQAHAAGGRHAGARPRIGWWRAGPTPLWDSARSSCRTLSARRRRSASPSSTPATPRPRSGPGLWSPRPSCTTGTTVPRRLSDAADHAIEAARAANCIEPLIWALNGRNISLAYLGRLNEACAGGEELISLARSAGMSGVAHDRAVWLALTLMDSGQVARGMSLAQAAHDEALAAGLLASAARCGDPMVTGLTWQGRFDEAETLLEERPGARPGGGRVAGPSWGAVPGPR